MYKYRVARGELGYLSIKSESKGKGLVLLKKKKVKQATPLKFRFQLNWWFQRNLVTKSGFKGAREDARSSKTVCQDQFTAYEYVWV